MLPNKVARRQPIRAEYFNEVISRLRALEPTGNTAGQMRGRRGAYQTVIGVNLDKADIPWASVVAVDELAVASGADVNAVLPGQTVQVRQVATGGVAQHLVSDQLFSWADPFYKLGILQAEMQSGQPVEVMTAGISICRLTRVNTDTGETLADRFRYAVPNAGIGGGGAENNRNALVAAPLGPFEILWEEDSDSLTAEHFAVVRVGLPVDQTIRLVRAKVAIPAESITKVDSICYGNLGVLPANGIIAPDDNSIQPGSLMAVAEAIEADKYGVGINPYDARVVVKGIASTNGFCGTAKDSFELSSVQTGFVSAGYLGAGRVAVRPFSGGIILKYSQFESDTLHLYATNVREAESDILALTEPLVVPEYPALNSAIVLDFNNNITGYGLHGVIENAHGIIGGWVIFIQYQTEDGIISDTSAFFSSAETGNGTNHYINFTVGRDTTHLRPIFGDIQGKTITGIGFRLVGSQTVDDINITLTTPRMGLLLANAEEFFT